MAANHNRDPASIERSAAARRVWSALTFIDAQCLHTGTMLTARHTDVRVMVNTEPLSLRENGLERSLGTQTWLNDACALAATRGAEYSEQAIETCG